MLFRPFPQGRGHAFASSSEQLHSVSFLRRQKPFWSACNYRLWIPSNIFCQGSLEWYLPCLERSPGIKIAKIPLPKMKAKHPGRFKTIVHLAKESIFYLVLIDYLNRPSPWAWIIRFQQLIRNFSMWMEILGVSDIKTQRVPTRLASH